MGLQPFSSSTYDDLTTSRKCKSKYKVGDATSCPRCLQNSMKKLTDGSDGNMPVWRCDPCKPRNENPNPNPNPYDYKIIASLQVGNNLVVKINYPNCKNYEGNKICLYKDADIVKLLQQESIDPHFSPSIVFLSPFARFEPTDDGWDAAVHLAEELLNDY